MNWLHSKKMGFYFSYVIGLSTVLLTPPLAQAYQSLIPVASASQLPKILRQIEAKYAKAGSIQAKFDQVTESAGLQRRKHSSGIITIKAPDKLRWETLSPDKNLLVSDGKKFWFYTPPFSENENGQVIERNGKDVRSSFMSALMAGSFSTAQLSGRIKITQKSPTEYSLAIKKGAAGTVTQAKIQIDQKEKLIKKVFLTHADGNTAEISLSEIRLGALTEDALFTFIAPAHTEVVKE